MKLFFFHFSMNIKNALFLQFYFIKRGNYISNFVHKFRPLRVRSRRRLILTGMRWCLTARSSLNVSGSWRNNPRESHHPRPQPQSAPRNQSDKVRESTHPRPQSAPRNQSDKVRESTHPRPQSVPRNQSDKVPA